MSIKIEPVRTAKDLAEFVNIQFDIHRDSQLWVAPIKKQEQELLSAGHHPFWKTARRELFIAFDNGRPAGRIAAIVDEKYNAYSKQACGAFGFFDCHDNREAAHALLDAARQWLQENGMQFMRGPLNPSMNYTCGMLVDGFALPPALMMPWNPPYYPMLLESWHLRKEQDLFAYTFDRANLEPPAWPKDEIERIKAQGRFQFRPASKKTMAEDIRIMLELYRQSWADNWGFSPLSEAEADSLVNELKGIADPDFFLLFFHKGEPAAGMVALPDMTPLLKRINGKIGLSAPWHYLCARKQLRQNYRIMLFGILPKYRLYGLPLLLFSHMLEMARRRPDFQSVEGSWVLEDNAAIDDLLEDFGGNLVKRYRIYRREIGSC